MKRTHHLVLPKALPAARRDAHRRIALPGTFNLRDLGGYRTLDGQALKWGALYRSDALHKLPKSAVLQLGELELATLLDLRGDVERAGAVDRLPPGHAMRVVQIPILDATEDGGAELKERISKGDVAGVDAAAMMRSNYRRYVTHYSPQYRQLVQEVLAAEGKPVLFHCTAGKDRSGFAAALLLRLLGVPYEMVVQDYLISQRTVTASLRRVIWLLRAFRGAATAQVVRQLSSAKPEYLAAAFEAVDEGYGSFAGYAAQGLGLDEGELARLRGSLLDGEDR